MVEDYWGTSGRHGVKIRRKKNWRSVTRLETIEKTGIGTENSSIFFLIMSFRNT